MSFISNQKDLIKFDAGYGLVSRHCMRDEKLTIEAKGIYAYLCSFAGSSCQAFPSVDLILKELGISKNRYFKHLKVLKDIGYVRVEKRRDEKGYVLGNLYILTFKPEVLHRQNLDIDNLDIDNLDIDNEDTNNNSINNNNINNINTSKDVFVPLSSGTDNSPLKTNFKKVLEEWNKLREPIPKLKSLNSGTKRHIMLKARLAEFGEDEVIKAIKNISNSDFLQGKATDFVISFDWFIKPNNFLKVYENNYANKVKNNDKDLGDDPYAEFYKSIL